MSDYNSVIDFARLSRGMSQVIDRDTFRDMLKNAPELMFWRGKPYRWVGKSAGAGLYRVTGKPVKG
jgi:hypothetical protein